MTTFVLVPGAGGDGAYWDELVPELERRGHTAIPVDIREDDPALGLPEYAAIVDDAIGAHTGVVVVAQSMGGFTAPMLQRRNAVARIVMLNAMIPLPGETPNEWFETTGAEAARTDAARSAGRDTDFDLDTYFLHDIPAEIRARMAAAESREPSSTPFSQPCDFRAWPEIPMHVVVGRDDRFFPAELQIRVARDRVHIEPDVIPGGHLCALSRPVELADLLVGYLDRT